MASSLTYAPALFADDAAAAYLSISVRRLNELQAKGEIIPVRVGRWRRYQRAELERWANNLPDWIPASQSNPT